MMNLIHAILNVERPESTDIWEFSPPVEKIASHLGIIIDDWNDDLLKTFKAYPIIEWMDTDEMVGIHALYLDGMPVGVTERRSRKDYSANVRWMSKECADMTRHFLLQYCSMGSKIIDTEEVVDPHGYHHGRIRVVDTSPVKGCG